MTLLLHDYSTSLCRIFSLPCLLSPVPVTPNLADDETQVNYLTLKKMFIYSNIHFLPFFLLCISLSKGDIFNDRR